MIRRGLVLALCVLSLTWGFALFVYDRWQRVNGFESDAVCDHIRTRIAAQFPFADIRCCDHDT